MHRQLCWLHELQIGVPFRRAGVAVPACRLILELCVTLPTCDMEWDAQLECCWQRPCSSYAPRWVPADPFRVEGPSRWFEVLDVNRDGKVSRWEWERHYGTILTVPNPTIVDLSPLGTPARFLRSPWT